MARSHDDTGVCGIHDEKLGRGSLIAGACSARCVVEAMYGSARWSLRSGRDIVRDKGVGHVDQTELRNLLSDIQIVWETRRRRCQSDVSPLLRCWVAYPTPLTSHSVVCGFYS